MFAGRGAFKLAVLPYTRVAGGSKIGFYEPRGRGRKPEWADCAGLRVTGQFTDFETTEALLARGSVIDVFNASMNTTSDPDSRSRR